MNKNKKYINILTNGSHNLVYGNYHYGDCHLMKSSTGTQKSAIQMALAQ